MPEGHTIHRIARDHQRWFAGQQVATDSPQGRFAGEADRLSGKPLREVTAHGKHLFYHWTRRQIVHVHLGLYGKFRLHHNPAPEPRGAVRLRVIGRDRTFDLNGPNRCQLISSRQYKDVKTRLGQDPLRDDALPQQAWQQVRRSRAAIGSLLLDQSIVAGIGNVYRAEILFLLRIDPRRPGNQMDCHEFDRMWQMAGDLMRIGVKYNRIITVDRDVAGKPLSRLRPGERLNIYKQPACPVCGNRVKSWQLGNRRIYACIKCQK